jgi:hypothetical protein
MKDSSQYQKRAREGGRGGWRANPLYSISQIWPSKQLNLFEFELLLCPRSDFDTTDELYGS